MPNGPPKYWTLRGASPTGSGTWEVRIPHALVEHVQRYGPEHKFHELRLVKEVLELPTVVFEGLREEQEEGLCYAGVPPCRYSNAGARLPVPPGRTFLVFVTVFQWRWEEMDPAMSGYPLDWRTRFGRQKWPKT